MKSTHLILKTMAFAVALSSACIAQATPYSYADITFSNLTLSGLSSPNLTITGGQVTTSSSANYGNAPGESRSSDGSLQTGSDTLQSRAGPGPFPGENNYGKALLSNFGTRGDAQITGNLVSGSPPLTVNAVSEGHLLSAVNTTSAASAAGTSTGFSFNFNVTSPTTLTLAFSAQEILNVLTTAAGDGASAQVSSSFSITRSDGTVQEFRPNALQGALTLSNIGSLMTDSGLQSFTHDFVLGTGTYEFSFLTGTQERLQARIPEPAPLVLLGIGMLGFAASRMRKADKHA